MKSFKASVFQGSSLVATAEDIRGLLEPGHEVFVNTVPYLTHGTKFPSKWTTKTVELSSDYTGETNLEAEISFMPKSRSARKLKPISLNKKASNKETKSVEVDEQVVDSLELIPKPPVDANTKAESASRKPNLRKLTEKKASKSHNQEGANVCAQDTEETKKRGAFCHDVAKKIHPNTDLKLVRRQGSVIPANKTAAATPTAPSSSTPRDMDDANDDSTSSVGNSTQRSLDEARKLAHERVLRKLQEDRKAVEQREEARQKALLEQVEKNQMKVRLLQEKTLQRVTDYKTGKERMKEEQERIIEEKTYVLQQDQEKVNSEEYARKMKKLHKEAAKRLMRFQDKELQAMEKQELELKEKLKQIKEDRDQNTTYRVARRQQTIYVHNVDEGINAVYQDEDDAIGNAEQHLSKAQFAGGVYGDYLPARTPPIRISKSLQVDAFEEDSLLYSPTGNNSLVHSPSAYIFHNEPQYAQSEMQQYAQAPLLASSSSMQRPSTVGSSDVKASSLYDAHSQGPMLGTKLAFPPEKSGNMTTTSKSSSKPKVSKLDLRDDSLFRPEVLNPDLIFEPPSPVAPPSVVDRIIEKARHQAVQEDSSSGEELDVPLNAIRNRSARGKQSEKKGLGGRRGESGGIRRVASAGSDSSNLSDITVEESPRRNFNSYSQKEAVKQHTVEQQQMNIVGNRISNKQEVIGLFHKVSLPLLEPPVPNPQLQMSSNKSNASGSTKKSKAKSFKRLQPIPIAPYQSVHKPPL